MTLAGVDCSVSLPWGEMHLQKGGGLMLSCNGLVETEGMLGA